MCSCIFLQLKCKIKELENQSKFRREDRILDSIKEFENTFFALLASQQRIKNELSADFFLMQNLMIITNCVKIRFMLRAITFSVRHI